MVLKAVDSAYIFTLHIFFTGYMGLSTKDIINNPMAQYRKITAADTKQKKKFLQEPLDTSHPIGVFFNTIDYRVLYSSEANTSLLSAQVIQMAYHVVIFSVIYTDVYKY